MVLFHGLAFPNHPHVVTQGSQCPAFSAIPDAIGPKLIQPKSLIGARRRTPCWTSMPMPEASVNENCDPRVLKHNVRTPGQPSVVHAVAATNRTQHGRHPLLRRRSCPRHGSHNFGPPLGRADRHWRSHGHDTPLLNGWLQHLIYGLKPSSVGPTARAATVTR